MKKAVLVTGSGKGIGKAIALNFASQGFDVAFHYKGSEEAAKKACQEALSYNVNAIALQADVTKPEQAQSLVKTAAEQLGGLSVVVNNVGNYLEHSMPEIPLEEWHEMLDTNLNSTFYVTQAAIPYLKEAGWGRIINFAFSSTQHLTAGGEQTAYRIAKAGVILYTKSIGKELINDNITANMIAPGMAENSVGLEESIPLLPKNRPATLQEICHAVDFLASPKSEYITGQMLEVAGGWRL